MNVKWLVGITARLWNSVNDPWVSWLFYECENIFTGVIFLVLDYNNIALEICNDVRICMTSFTETWLSKNVVNDNKF